MGRNNICRDFAHIFQGQAHNGPHLLADLCLHYRADGKFFLLLLVHLRSWQDEPGQIRVPRVAHPAVLFFLFDDHLDHSTYLWILLHPSRIYIKQGRFPVLSDELRRKHLTLAECGFQVFAVLDEFCWYEAVNSRCELHVDAAGVHTLDHSQQLCALLQIRDQERRLVNLFAFLH